MRREWWAIVWIGHAGEHPMPPSGAYRSLEDAHEALWRWRNRVGWVAGTIESMCSIRIYGPYRTRAEARNADISEWPEPY